jgi:hypothetical protein
VSTHATHDCHAFCAGQAIVQMARSRHSIEQEWAIKFFLSREAYQAEAAVYADLCNPLREYLPQVRMHAPRWHVRPAHA